MVRSPARTSINPQASTPSAKSFEFRISNFEFFRFNAHVSAGCLKLYRFIEDAWAGGLRAWCEGEGESWILAGNPGQQRWLLRKLAQTGKSGIQIFDAAGLRAELARRAGLEPPPGVATAAFAVKVAARDPEAARGATALAEACDALARAGWHLNQLTVDPAIAQRLHRMLDREPVLPGFFDRRLHTSHDSRASHIPRLCCIGWDASHWPDLGLLDVAAANGRAFEMYVPSPRLPADAQQREWIEALEQRLGLERATCPESGFASENEPLVARLENSQLASRAEARPPGLLVGREWSDQVRLVCGQTRAWLAENPTPDAPIGIIAPEDSPTAVAVAEALEAAGIRVEHPGRKRELAARQLIIEQATRYHLGGHDIAELLELARLLWLHARTTWNALDPEKVRDALDRALQAAQSRNARILARALPLRKDPAWMAVRKLIETLGRWDEDCAWPALLEKYRALLAALLPGNANLPIGIASPTAPPSILFPDERIPARAFIEWLADQLAAERMTVAPPDYAGLPPVVVTTFAEAAQQTWERLIFLDSNEHVWPAPIAENRFLPDAARIRLNRNRKESALLLTTRDQRALDQSRFLDLLEHCRGSIAFAGVLLAHTDTGDYAQPNEWVLRSLLETSADDVFPPDLWTGSAQACTPAPPPALEPGERAHLEMVDGSRHDGTKPFDRYQFDFQETRLEPGAWAATDLDDAVICPATFALRTLFGVQSTADWAPVREEGAAVGNRAHRWLGRILGSGGRLSRPGPAGEDEAKLAAEMVAASSELDQWYREEGLAVPLWWVTCLRKAGWAARRCLREVRGWLEGNYCVAEQSVAASVATPAGPLPLKGRIDILISDRPEMAGAHVRIFDFKTGRGTAAPSLATLERGSGAQFAAYYLMARDAGAAEAVIGIIKPEARALDIFSSADEASLRARFAVLAGLRRTLRFGRRGPLVADYGVCETLPLATTPIDPAILDQKAGLFLLAS